MNFIDMKDMISMIMLWLKISAGLFYTQFYVCRWYLEDRLNTMIQQCVEHGIFKYFDRKSSSIMDLGSGDDTNVEAVAGLAMDEFKLCFGLFVFGIAISFFVFAMEILVFRLFA